MAPLIAKVTKVCWKEQENNSLKRSKRIRIHATEGREEYNGNVLPRMPAIPELQVDESSSNSSSEKINNLPRRKRSVFLASLANNWNDLHFLLSKWERLESLYSSNYGGDIGQ